MTAGRALNAPMLYYLFDSANMHRWNDHLRPLDLTELDKQAHKAAIAWVLGRYEEDAGNVMDWSRIIEHTLFSFLQRVALTDLKPQIFHRIVAEKEPEVNTYVLQAFDRAVPVTDAAFRRRFEEYLNGPKDTREDAVIRAAHYLATRWEFNVIYDANRSLYGIEDTRREIDEQIEQHADLAGVRQLMADKRSFDFVDVFGQLRFQQRWARTPRIPNTTVLGHSLLVADMAYLNDLDHGIAGSELYNDFYSGLYHDLPEVLTKDVISPVKVHVNGLPALLEGVEHELMEKRIMPLIPEGWRDDLRFMSYEPFEDTDGTRRHRWGRAVKACDLLSAWMEAHISICYGVSSQGLRDGEQDIRRKLLQPNGFGDCIGAAEILREFDGMKI